MGKDVAMQIAAMSPEYLAKEDISDDAFYSQITLLPDKKHILISGSNSGNYVLYDLEKMEIIKKQESYVNASNIVVLDKIQKL